MKEVGWAFGSRPETAASAQAIRGPANPIMEKSSLTV
jgi:hypothetical protein